MQQPMSGGQSTAARPSSRTARASVRAAHRDSIEDRHDFVVGLLVPINGSAGIWGPSSIACAQLAQAEINAAGGLQERRLQLRIVDSSDEALDVGHVTGDLMRRGAIDAIVGMHTSQVRQRVLRDVARQIPYVYTPLYEGGERTPGVFAIGETPGQQLQPAIEHLMQRYRARRWVFIGNDYCWPRVSHKLAARYVADRGGQVLADRYLPFGVEDHSQLLDEVRRLRPNAILLSLVGQDAVNFNRAFGRCGLSRDMLRLSCAIEENGLLAMGADNTDGLFVSSGYFGSLDNDANMAFKERYHNHFGDRAPTLNSLGQSTYEGMHFMAALARRAADDDAPLLGPLAAPLAFRSVRGTCYFGNHACKQHTFLAAAQGHLFQSPIAL
ncbi:MAG TPA: substrate-binding domain-containing protein [Burkholderiaceae bacterium]|nr:substrate-binding domain-containing protein [Burkholderiaceae bacterium]